MKWTNKGHQFDHLRPAIERAKRVYLFGAGQNGIFFFERFSPQLQIVAFVDNSTAKQGTTVCGLKVLSPAQLPPLGEDEAVVITPRTFAREHIAIHDQLVAQGVPVARIFPLDRFCSLYSLFVQDKVCFSVLDTLPTTVCNLNCTHCLNFTPHIRRHETRPLAQLTGDLDLLFRCVDYILFFHVTGGEPTLHPHLVEYLDYFGTRYRDRVGLLGTTTNCTRPLSEELLNVCERHDIEIELDDYTAAVPQCRDAFDDNLRRIQERGLRHRINRASSWIDLMPPEADLSGAPQTELIRHFAQCANPFAELRNGRISNCNYSGFASFAGLVDELPSDFYDLRDFTPDKKAELVEFRLGCSERGYMEFCKKCAGFCDNNHVVPPAAQVQK